MDPRRRGTLVLAALAALVIGTDAAATTITVQPSSQDAYILQDSPNRPKGSGTGNTRFYVRTSTPNPRIRRGLVQFDLSAVPQFSTINSAILSLYQDSSPTGAAHTHGAYRIDAAWLQSTVKWNTQPAIQAVPTASNATVGPVRQFYDWTVTPDVALWVNTPSANHGWMMKDAAETATNEIIAYVSSEENANPDLFKRPKLAIDYTAPACSTNADCAEVPNNLCTTNERCQAGHCAVDPVVCNDNDACTDDICDPMQGCLFPVGECNDGFSCTIDTCDQVLGCVNTPVDAACTADGCKVGTCVADPDDTGIDPATGCDTTLVQPDNTPCNSDGLECTADKCLAGACTHPSAPFGTPCSADGNVCTDDVCDGSGICHVNNTVPCTDSNGCTVGDVCGGGSCVPGPGVTCTAQSQCHNVGTCNPGTGLCSNPPKPDGATCNDSDACTQTDECNGSGTCVGENPVICTASGQCFDVGTCNPGTGVCSNPPKPDGATCNDSDACTQTDECNGSGTCVGENPVICAASGQCFDVGICNPGTGVCSNPPKPSGAGCIDGDACTQTDECNGSGTCVGANAVVCAAAGQCFDVGTCNPGTGVCSDPPKPDGATCSDSDACTQTDECDGAGTCVGENPVVCTPLDQCHDTGTCDTGTGICSDPVKNDGEPCSDGNTCTLADTCTGGLCQGDPMTCGDGTVQASCGEECDTAGVTDNCTAQCQFVCGPAPATNCRKPLVSKKASVLLKNRTPDKKDSLSSKWAKGAATTALEFGDPVNGATSYILCIYDESANPQPRLFAKAPAGGTCGSKPCWKLTKTGFKYGDRNLDPDGISKIVLRAGAASKAKALVRGKGVNLGMFALPATPTVTVQLMRSDNLGICWDAEFSTPIKNLSDQFKSFGD